MRIYDLQGSRIVESETQLLERLHSVRSGPYGAFELAHEQAFPSLFVHIYQQFAYIHYFPEDGHPGYQPKQMTPRDSPSTVPFRMIDASPLDMPAETLCTVDDAYHAAVEFFHDPAMPSCINWFEL